MTEDFNAIAELNRDEFTWVIVSKTEHGIDYELHNRPFLYQAQAHIVSVDLDHPEYPECESERATVIRHMDLIRARCDEEWTQWSSAEVVNLLFPEGTIRRNTVA
jgi:hypothetical protein